MQVAIVTGTSKGLGESIANQLLAQGMYVYGISRSERVSLSTNDRYTHFACDIGDTSSLQKTLDTLIQRINKTEVENIYIVNNAAVLQPINHVMAIDAEELAYHVQVNTIAPMIIMNRLLQEATKNHWHAIGVNITSGAAESPMYGWSAYCSTKASINMYTKTVALEQEELETNHKVIAFSPGIMDTDMQEKIRASSEASFKDVNVFRGYKENNELKDVNIVSNILINIITKKDQLINGEIYYVRDYF